jgi:hypothetical protein
MLLLYFSSLTEIADVHMIELIWAITLSEWLIADSPLGFFGSSF